MVEEDSSSDIANVQVAVAAVLIIWTALWWVHLDEYYLKLLQPLGTFSAVVISVWIAASQPRRARQAAERAVAIAAAKASHDGLELVAERMRPRLDPSVQQAEGRTLRGWRSRATVEALKEIGLSDLPPELIPHFNRVRSGLSALTEAMDVDGWPAVREPLSRLQLRRFERYAASFTWAADGYEAMRTYIERCYEVELEAYGWRVPTQAELRARDEVRFPGIAPRRLGKLRT
jgi:hypothetical protein